jgi:hypothetical protein
MRLDDASFEELLKINPKISKVKVKMGNQSLPVSVYALSDVI